MSQDWYYEDNGQRQGPVSPAMLKKLADSGQIRPETRVWRPGMAQWAEARAIRGLFPGGQPAAPAPTAAPARPAAPSAASPAGRAHFRFGHGRHPLDLAIDHARNACPANLATTLSRSAGQVGIYVLYAAAGLVPVVGLLISTRTGALRPLAVSIAIGVCLVALQYVGARLLGACEAAIQANKSVLPSLAIPDCTFVLCIVGTGLGVIGLIGAAIAGGVLNPVFGALALLVVGGFTALVVIEPAGINVGVDPECGAGQEAVGVLTFLVKVLLRGAPIAFAAAVTFATCGLVSLGLEILRASEGQEVLVIATVRALVTATTLFAAAAIPVCAYVLLLFYYLTLDVLSAIVSIPRKLDAIAEVGRTANGNGQPES